MSERVSERVNEHGARATALPLRCHRVATVATALRACVHKSVATERCHFVATRCHHGACEIVGAMRVCTYNFARSALLAPPSRCHRVATALPPLPPRCVRACINPLPPSVATSLPFRCHHGGNHTHGRSGANESTAATCNGARHVSSGTNALPRVALSLSLRVASRSLQVLKRMHVQYLILYIKLRRSSARLRP